MPRRGDEVVVLWPRYFDARRSRAEGRRVPKELAVRDPDAAWVHKAAERVGLEATLEEKARDPFLPWKVVGRVVVQGRGGKESTIRAVAQRMQGG